MFDFKCDGIRWGYTFLRTDSRLTEEQRTDIMYRATSMYLLDKEAVQNFKDHDMQYEGKIATEGKFGSLGGGLWGQIYDAEVDTEFGKAKVKFMISEQTAGSRMSVSNN